MISKEDFRDKLRGPVFPVLTPFLEDGSAVDHSALERYVDFLASNSVSAILTTVGTSRFNLLSEEEMLAVNETVTKAAAKRCMVILSGPMTGNTSTNLSFAAHASKLEADAYIAFFPERYYGNDALFQFYATLAQKADIGIMIHEMPIRSGYGGAQQYTLDLLERLTSLPNIFGMKEECMDAGHAHHIHRALEDTCGIIGAGSMRLFMRDYHSGGRAYLVGIGSFFPRVAKVFYKAMVGNETAKAHSIVRTYEEPYFDLAVSLGWHIALKETLNILGLMPGFERNPMPRLSKSQREKLRGTIEDLGWLNLEPAHEPLVAKREN